MTAPPRRSPFLRATSLALLVAAAAACGGSEDASPQPPRATFAGQLRAAPSGPAQGPLRLALAWYPGLLSETATHLSRPGAIETRDVAYAGALPQAYAFDVRGAPPASALVPLPAGLAGKGAAGVLLAYQDRNGNRRLDTIPADGAPIDRVVGASLEWSASPAFLVVYLTDDQPPSTGLRSGFNVLRIVDPETTEVVPLSTPIPIAISAGGARLDLFVCEAAWDGSGTQAPCGLQLDEQVLDADVQGEIFAGPAGAEAAFGLTEMAGGAPAPISDATVTLDGVEIPFDPESGFYWAPALDPALFAEERTVELVATRGDRVLRRAIAIPAFDLTEVPATVRSGAAFDVSWTVPASAESFDLVLFAGSALFLNVVGLEGAPYHVAPIDHVGEARLTVSALARAETWVTVVRSTTLTFEAAP